MSLIDQLGVALGLATLAGVNLYLTVLVAGLAIRFHWVELSGAYEHLAVLGDPWILGVAGGMFLVEFVADKIPWLDSVWDVVHTLVRPVGAILLAVGAMGDLNPVVVTVGALLAGTASLATHGTKAGLRAILNLSPEPVTNSAASVTEDGLVLGGLGLIGFFPGVALVVFLAVVAICAVIAMKLWRRIGRIRKQPRGKTAAVVA